MRIRNFRSGDMLALALVQQAAATIDHSTPMATNDFFSWLLDPASDSNDDIFVMTDDDDELLTWGQGGTLEGIEGEIAGYTVLRCHQDSSGYHLLCQGAVHPEQRRRHAGLSLLGGALNRARLIATEFEFEAELAGIACYFEALLPISDETSKYLAAKYTLVAVQQNVVDGLQLYRGELYS